MSNQQFYFTQITSKFWVAELTYPYSETFDKILIDNLIKDFAIKGIKLTVLRHY